MSKFVEDHPRLCGENVVSSIYASFCAGSPPPVRGKLIIVYRHPPETGITPACAGKTKHFRI